MENLLKLLGIIVVVFAFVNIACDNGSSNGENSVSYTSTAGETTYTLSITQNTNRYVITTGDTYVLAIINSRTTKNSSGTVTVSGGGSTLVLSGGTDVRVTIDGGRMISITGTIQTNDGIVEGPGSLTPHQNNSNEDNTPPNSTDDPFRGTSWYYIQDGRRHKLVFSNNNTYTAFLDEQQVLNGTYRYIGNNIAYATYEGQGPNFITAVISENSLSWTYNWAHTDPWTGVYIKE